MKFFLADMKIHSIFVSPIKGNIMTHTSTTTTVRFHVGRGGSFNNQGHLSYHGECTADELINLRSDDLFYNPLNHYEVMAEIADRRNIEALYLDCFLNGNFSEFTQKTGIEVTDEWGHFDLNGILMASDSEIASGEISLEWDYAYNTDIICRVDDLSDARIQLIIDENDTDILEEIAQCKGFSDLAIRLIDYFNAWDDLINIIDPEDYVECYYAASETENEDDDCILIDGLYYSKK